jgi:pentatricopeptide repeat protein
VHRLVAAGPSDGRGNKSYRGNTSYPPPQKRPFSNSNKPRDEIVQAILSFDSDWKGAVALLADLRTKKIASLGAFNAAILVCARSHQAAKALELLLDMEDCNITPNVTTVTSVINACAKARQWQPALEVLEYTETNFGLEPSVITLSAVITTCVKGGQWQKALELLESMNGRGLESHVITLNAAITACEKAWSKQREQNTVDLHNCTAAESRAAIECLLQDVRSGGRACQDITVITGRGMHSAGGMAVLPDEIRSFLLEINGPAFTEVPENPGVLLLADQDLRDWLGKKR